MQGILNVRGGPNTKTGILILVSRVLSPIAFPPPLQGVPIPTANRFMKRGQYLVTFESGGSKHSVVWLWRAPDRPPRNGEKSPKVKSDSRGFSGGWKGFARDHGLVTGDAVVFEKVCNRRFRLHLFRRSDYGGNVERAAKAANEKGERLDGEGGGEDSASTGGPKKRAIAGEETEVGVGRSVGKQSTPVDVSGGGATGTTDGTTGKGVPGIVTNKKGRSLEEGADEGSREKRRKVGVGEHEREGAKESGEALIAENTEDIGLRLGAERRLRGVETLVEMANKKKSSQFERIMSTKISLVIKELTNARNGPLAAEAGRPRLGERMETGVNAKKGRETFALGDPQVGKRHAKVTDCFPVVKKARVGVPNGSVKEEEGRCENGLKERSLPAGTAVVTAGTTAGREPERSGGGKRVKHTPKRGHSQVRGGSESKKRARIDGKEPPRKVQKGARVGVVPAERKSGTADEPEAEYEGGRLVHYVDGGHRYVEASAADKDAAKAAMEKCASAFPTFRVALSKSQTDKGFWLVRGQGRGFFCVQPMICGFSRAWKLEK